MRNLGLTLAEYLHPARGNLVKLVYANVPQLAVPRRANAALGQPKASGDLDEGPFQARCTAVCDLVADHLAELLARRATGHFVPRSRVLGRHAHVLG
ncbi:hypothetical protein [Acetobacter nitrogenifigens]|uniref:hypothetical protein n=1 Tax=Acetobacter nitrogenifigens TaxID=285268 RepID=UPI0004080177|nr:hypothetical protein [Acetobacter nitrogenifigens]